MKIRVNSISNPKPFI